MNCLARIGRRHTAWETDDVSKIVKTELGAVPDPRVKNKASSIGYVT